jgi:DNA repair exonuclease SbcCD nuclease subunit
MSKILLFADIHLHPHKRSTDRLQDCLNVLNWIFQTAVDKKIKNVVFLGDLLHDRQKIDVLTYQRTFEIFEKYLGFEPKFYFHALLGNHDLWHWQKGDISSVNPFRALPGITVVDKPTTKILHDGNSFFPISFLPYTTNPVADLKEVEESWEARTKQKWDKNHRILCGHVAIDGAVWNVLHETYAEVTVEHDGDMVKVGSDIFKNWTKVFLGHYHAAQKLCHNVEYIGSPLQLSFGEAFQDKKILIYDWETREQEYVLNDFSPQHLIIPEVDVEKYDLKGNFVRIMTEDLSSDRVIETRKLLVEQGVATLEIKQSPKQETHVVKDATAILERGDEMLQKYIQQIDIGKLNKDKLFAIGKKVCETRKEDLDDNN